jgi:hypothetical protein
LLIRLNLSGAPFFSVRAANGKECQTRPRDSVFGRLRQANIPAKPWGHCCNPADSGSLTTNQNGGLRPPSISQNIIL